MLLALLLACGHSGEAQRATPAANTTSAPSARPAGQADVSALTPVNSGTGLSWYVVHEGNGPVAAVGDKVSVNYTGWFATGGTPFDTSDNRGQPLQFTLGQRRVIAGWEEGIAGMKIGEKRQLHVPSGLGYGGRGMGGVIPPNADLVFDVELVGIEGK